MKKIFFIIMAISFVITIVMTTAWIRDGFNDLVRFTGMHSDTPRGMTIFSGIIAFVSWLHFRALMRETIIASFHDKGNGVIGLAIKMGKSDTSNKIISDFLRFGERESIKITVLEAELPAERTYDFSIVPDDIGHVAEWMQRHRIEIHDPKKLLG